MPTKMTVSQVVERLAATRQESGGRHVIDGIQCRRVGRNEVWQIATNGAVSFVTFCQNEDEFRRRLTGIELTGRLAREDPNIATPQVEAVIEEARVIVVHKAMGIRADRLFQLGYRIDKNPFRRRAARGHAMDVLASIKNYLCAVHRCIPSSREFLWDHGPEGVRSRVQSHLDRLSQRVNRLRGLRLPDLPHVSKMVLNYVLGDTTLGNFVIDGHRVTCVDFEDLGFGEPRRDLVLLQESLKRALGQWHYWSDDVGSLVPGVQAGDPWCAMYALEPQLLRVSGELEKSRSGAHLEREVEAARRQLLALSDRVGPSS